MGLLIRKSNILLEPLLPLLIAVAVMVVMVPSPPAGGGADIVLESGECSLEATGANPDDLSSRSRTPSLFLLTDRPEDFPTSFVANRPDPWKTIQKQERLHKCPAPYDQSLARPRLELLCTYLS